MTTQQEYNAMASEQAGEAALNDLPNDSYAQLRADLSSGSTVSRWRLLLAIVAYHISLLRAQWAIYRQDVISLAKDGHFGTRRWFVAKAKAFQFGHSLVFTNLDAHYALDVKAARIVTHAACVEMANRVIVKVAKKNGTGLQMLEPAEYTAIQDYFADLRPPVQVSVLTADPDLCRMYGYIVYDPQAVTLSAVQAACTFAAQQYLRQLEFGGVMRVTDLRAALLAVPGVVDVRLDRVLCRSIGPYVQVPRIYQSYAGHMAMDNSTPLSTSIQWAAGNV